MLTLVTRDLRKFASALAAGAVVSFGLVAVDQGHVGSAGRIGTASVEAPAESRTVVTLPEVVVVAERIDT
jgi:hypothetical protein